MDTLRGNERMFSAHVVYGLLLILLGLGVSAALDAFSQETMITNALATAAIVVPASLLLASRFGRLTLLGVVMTTILASVVSQVIAFAVISSMASSSSNMAAMWHDFPAAMFLEKFALAVAIVVGASIAWTYVLRVRVVTRAS